MARPRIAVAVLCALVLAVRADIAAASMNCSEETFCLETQVSRGVTTFTAINQKKYLPLTVSIKLELDNLRIAEGVNLPFVLRGGERRQLFSLARINSRQSWEYAYEYVWVTGDLGARHQTGHLYRLPYAADRSYAVSQGCNGSYSHHGSGKYAVDFDMPTGTPVLAARAGRVVDIKQDSNRGGEGEEYENDANYVFIQHDDGTLGQYFHLRQNSVIVKAGQWVEAGTAIAEAGNTGFSSGPHLHFEVVEVHLGQGADDEPDALSVPITFDTRRGTVTCPADGVRLQVK